MTTTIDREEKTLYSISFHTGYEVNYVGRVSDSVTRQWYEIRE